jgi:hypothetical protein
MGMLMTFEEASELIGRGDLLHIAGTEGLIRRLPKGNWVGGSTEYFMAKEGGVVSGERLFVTAFPYADFSIKTYGAGEIETVAVDAFENGFSIVVIPFDSAVHKAYAEHAPGYEQMFLRNVAGWIAGVNLGKPGQTPVAANGLAGEACSDRAVALHIGVPGDKAVTIGVINIFSQDEESPAIEFPVDGFSADRCLVGGEERSLAEYVAENELDTKLPLVGDYAGNGVNVSFKSIEGGRVNFYAPVFAGITYRMAKAVPGYADEFNNHLADFRDASSVFSCNCILNFLYGELEGKTIEAFNGPITFGEIAYQLVNQTLVYVSVL